MFLRSIPSRRRDPRRKKPTPASRHPELARDLLFSPLSLPNSRHQTACFLERVEKVASWPVWSFLTPCPPSLTARSSLGTSGAQRRLRARVGEPDRSLLSGSPSLPRLSGRGMQGRGRGLGLSSHPLRTRGRVAPYHRPKASLFATGTFGASMCRSESQLHPVEDRVQVREILCSFASYKEA